MSVNWLTILALLAVICFAGRSIYTCVIESGLLTWLVIKISSQYIHPHFDNWQTLLIFLVIFAGEIIFRTFYKEDEKD